MKKSIYEVLREMTITSDLNISQKALLLVAQKNEHNKTLKELSKENQIAKTTLCGANVLLKHGSESTLTGILEGRLFVAGEYRRYLYRKEEQQQQSQ